MNPGSGPTVFANITNHPSAEWSEEQRRAALRLADRIVDIPFPEVPPEADGDAVAKLADDVLAQLPPGTTHALVQGEFTLTMELVRRLQDRGIRCLAATTVRDVETREDGSQLRRFRFVRFRDYPRLS